MLRQLLLYFSQAGWARRIVSDFWLARRVARRFVAGETLDEAVTVCHRLNDDGLLVTLDYLGESVTSADDTCPVVEMYCTMLDRIIQEGLQASVSLKLTHLGLDIDEMLCVNNLRQILSAAHNVRVTIDMESSHYTDTTLRIYRCLRDEFPNLGTVIQAALRRSRDDMHQLAAEKARIRLCKGAYLEPPDIAFPRKSDVDDHYRQIVHEYLQSDGLLEIATHDEAMIEAALTDIDRFNVSDYEFQMLYGIRSDRQVQLARAGSPVRVYVPFGESWYSYFMRRLAERPANLWFFLRSL